MHRTATPLLALAALLLALGLPLLTASPSAEPAADAPAYGSLDHVLREGRGSGLDKGTFDLYGVDPLPVGWVWVPDATDDGSGQEYVALHTSYVFPGPQAQSVTYETRFVANQNHTTLQAFLAWVVATNPHVNDVSELDIRVRNVSPVNP